MKNLLLFFLLFIINVFAFSQSSSLLADFRVRQVNNNVLITWVISANNQCLGLEIEHSTDSINFSAIHEYQGICGAGSANEKYDYIHVSPVNNTINYYRIKLGDGGYSAIETIKINQVENIGYSLFPNPITNQSKIYFDSDYSISELIIYSSSGKEILNQTLEQPVFSFENLFMANGIYFFSLKTTKKIITGKFVVVY